MSRLALFGASTSLEGRIRGLLPYAYAMTVETGQTFGRYRVQKVLGRGGFATVFLALDPALQRMVAVKVLHEQLAADPMASARFLDEARQLAQLRHPNIVVVHDVGEESGRAYFAMEYQQGQELEALLEARGTLTLQDTINVALQLGAALDYLHARGIIHRDLKPSNLMVSAEGRLTLMDFGIARALGQTGHTSAGTVIGTPAYMAPEQVRGQPVSPATDVYAMAVLLYHCLGGKPPFEGDPLAVMHQHVAEPPPPLAGRTTGLPPDVYAAVESGLAKDPAARPRGGGVLAQMLAGAGGVRMGGGPAAQPLPPAAPAPPPPGPPPAMVATPPPAWTPRPAPQPPARRRSPWPIVTAAGVFLALAAGGGAFYLNRANNDGPVEATATSEARLPPAVPSVEVPAGALPIASRTVGPRTAVQPSATPSPTAATAPPAASVAPVPPGDYRVVQNLGSDKCLRARADAGSASPIYVCALDAFIVRLIEGPKNVGGVNWWNAEGLGWMAERDGNDTFLGRTSQPAAPRATFACLRLALTTTIDGAFRPPSELRSTVTFSGARFIATNDTFNGWVFGDTVYLQYRNPGGAPRTGSVIARRTGDILSGTFAATAFDSSGHGAYGTVAGGTTGC